MIHIIQTAATLVSSAVILTVWITLVVLTLDSLLRARK